MGKTVFHLELSDLQDGEENLFCHVHGDNMKLAYLFSLACSKNPGLKELIDHLNDVVQNPENPFNKQDNTPKRAPTEA